MTPGDGIHRLRDKDAILLGAVGCPAVPDHVSLWGLLIPVRRGFRQYVGLRSVRVFEGVDGPVRGAVASEVDFVVVRENVEGGYSEVGRAAHLPHGGGLLRTRPCMRPAADARSWNCW